MSAATAARRVVVWIAKTLSSRPPPRFAKYQPAPRFGTRPLEDRLLRRLRSTATESMR